VKQAAAERTGADKAKFIVPIAYSSAIGSSNRRTAQPAAAIAKDAVIKDAVP
jgi:hypothetical protein